MRERGRTQARYRVRKAEGRLEQRIDRLDRPKPSYLGVRCETCGCDTIPMRNGTCGWCGAIVVAVAA